MYAIVALAKSEPAEIQKYFDGTVEVSLLSNTNNNMKLTFNRPPITIIMRDVLQPVT